MSDDWMSMAAVTEASGAGGAGSGGSGGAAPKGRQAKDAQSLSNRLKKAVNMKKTKMQARIGATKAPKDFYSPAFKTQNDRIKAYLDVITDYIKACGGVKESMLAYLKTSRAVGDALTLFSRTGFAAEDFQAILSTMVNTWTAMDASREVMIMSIVDVSLYKSNLYVKNYLMPARRAKEQYRDAIIQVAAAENVVTSCLAAKVEKPAELLVALTHKHYAERKARVRLLEASNRMEDATSIKEAFIVETFASVMKDMSSFYSTSCELFGGIQAELQSASEIAASRRAAVQEEIKELEASWREEKQRKHEDRFVPLTLLLAASDLALVAAITSVSKIDPKLSIERVVRILDAYDLTLPIIRLGIQEEVEETTSPTTLFRSNSTSTKLISAFTRITGGPYLNYLVRDFLVGIVASSDSYEVDPAKATESENVEANVQLLMNRCEELMERVFASLDQCPLPFRIMAHELRMNVEKKFPGSGLIAVGGFFFLRFMCPPLAAPDATGLVTELTPKGRRASMLIGKIVQNLSNGVDFSKEQYMLPFNDFLSRFSSRMIDFQTQLSEPLSSLNYDKLASISQVNSVELPELQKFLVENLDDVVEFLRTHEFKDHVHPVIQVIGTLEAETS